MDNYPLADNFRRRKLWAAKNLNAAPLHRRIKQPFEIGKSCAGATFALSFSICNLKPTAKSFLSRSGTHLTDGKCTKRNLGCLNANKPENGRFKQFQKYKANRSNATTSSHLNLCRHRQRFVSQTFPKMHASVHFQICCKIPLDFSAQAHNNESAAFNRAASREKLIQNRQTPPDWFGFSPNKMRIFYVCISPSVPFSYGRQGQGGHLPTGSILPVSHTLPFVCRPAVWERKGGINR